MRRLARWLALASGLTAFGQTPVVSDLHTVSIHVNGVESYNAAFRLLTQDLGWPAIYGKLLTTEEGSKRNYAGIWAGNVVLEICGPYPKEFSPGDRPVRLHGLTFSPHLSAERSAAELKRRDLRFRGPVSWSPGATFVILEDDALIRPQFSISIMDLADRQGDRAEREKARNALEAADGGAIGLRAVVEVAVLYEDEGVLAKWRQFLSEAPSNGGEGPRLQLGKGSRNGIQAIVVRVKKRDRAAALQKRAEALGIPLAMLE